MVRTDAFIRKRKLSSAEVAKVNYVLKARARRYIAAGSKEWLYPEKTVTEAWKDLYEIFLPPRDDLWHFGGEMYASFEDGRTYYQDAFGRTEKEREFLKKKLPKEPLRDRDLCGCGSGLSFKKCCKSVPAALRSSWTEVSIRERNLMFFNAMVRVLGLDQRKDWITVRRELTDEKISKICQLYEGLWPLETDLFQLLPKPDGRPRAIYTGSIHPSMITKFALGASLYFGELVIQHPFLHPSALNEKFNPVKNPSAYRQEFLKSVVFFLTLMPMIEQGTVNLIPDPCNFDLHLRDQMHGMAQARSIWVKKDLLKDAPTRELLKEDSARGLMSAPRDVLRKILKKTSGLDDERLEEVLLGIERLRESDPLAVLQEDGSAMPENSEQFHLAKLAPNFEMTMYLAQATGSCIVTDDVLRWKEITRAMSRQPDTAVPALANNIEASKFAFPQEVEDIQALAFDATLSAYPKLMGDAFSYLSKLGDGERKPNFEGHLAARFSRMQSRAQAAIRKSGVAVREARLLCAFPVGGIQDNTINRLLLMSSSERHLPSAPAAFFIDGQFHGKKAPER
jgi:hypothetical protein